MSHRSLAEAARYACLAIPDNLRFRDPATNEMKPATEAVMEESIRKEGRDFFKIADDLSVYPVIQFAIGARF